MAKKSKKKNDAGKRQGDSAGTDVTANGAGSGKGGGKARRKAEKQAAALAAALKKVRKKAEAQIEKAQQAIQKAEKRAEKARSAADAGSRGRGAGAASEVAASTPAAPTSPTPTEPGSDANNGGPDYAVPLPVGEASSSLGTVGESSGVDFSPADGASLGSYSVTVPEAVSPNGTEGSASPERNGERPASDGSAAAGDVDDRGVDASDLTPPLPKGDPNDEPNAAWTETRIRSLAEERGIAGFESKSKDELLEILKG